MKSGSTWLHLHLARIPGVGLPHEKETFFFDREFDRGIEWYRAQFGGHQRELCGELAPSYFDDPRAVDRIARWYPTARIILTLRDPIDRAWSHYLHLRRTRRVPGMLRSAVACEPRIIGASHYSEHLPRWRSRFPDQATHLLPLERIQRDPEAALREVLRHVGLDDTQPLVMSTVRANAGYVPQSVWLEWARRLAYQQLRRRHLFRILNSLRPVSRAIRRVPWLRSRPAPLPDASERDFLLDALGAEQAFYRQLLRRMGLP